MLLHYELLQNDKQIEIEEEKIHSVQFAYKDSPIIVNLNNIESTFKQITNHKHQMNDNYFRDLESGAATIKRNNGNIGHDIK